jgi:hypothetical protein
MIKVLIILKTFHEFEKVLIILKTIVLANISW